MNNALVIEKEQTKNSTSNYEDVVLKTWHLFLILNIVSLVIIYVNNNFIFTREVFHQLYSKQMEAYRIDEYFDVVNNFSLWGYLIIPLVLLLKITLFTLLLQLPLTLKFIELKFKVVFRIVTIANIPLIISELAKTFWLVFTPYNEFTNEFLSLVPLSITNLIDITQYSTAITGFLNSINLFEFVWIFLVFIGLYRSGKVEKYDAFLISFSVWFGTILFQLELMLYLNS